MSAPWRILWWLLVVAASSACPLAAQEETTLTWSELVPQAGLFGLEDKKQAEFKVDRLNDFGSIMVVRAEIPLTEKDWEWLNRDDELHLLRPWKSGIITHEEWRDTMGLIPPGEEWKVNTDHLGRESPSVVLREGISGDLRVYILNKRPSDGRKCLYYFFMSIPGDATFTARAQTPATALTTDTLTWEELSAQAGLMGLQAKAREQFVVDRFNDKGGLRAIRAEILLTDEDSRRLKDNYRILSPWLPRYVKPEEWKNTVEGGYSGEGRVNARHLDIETTPGAMLLRGDQKSIRIYLLGERPGDGKKCLYYFYRKGD